MEDTRTSVGPDWYHRGISKAEKSGLIRYASEGLRHPALETDDYSHIAPGDGALVLKFTNTRPLSSIAKAILSLYVDHKRLRFLELGPGAGVACASVSRLRPDAIIDSVSLTPLNPYLRFSDDDIYGTIIKPSWSDPAFGLYGSSRIPFVHKQYIGRFPHMIRPPDKSYHFIYENYGPIFWNLLPNEACDMVECASATISSALSLLRDDGTILIMASYGAHQTESLLESFAESGDTLVTSNRKEAYDSVPCLLARKEGPFRRWIRENLSPGAQRVLRLEPGQLQAIATRICCDMRSIAARA